MRRRSKRRLDLRALLWAALAANVAAGFVWSPSTAVRRVRVRGAPESVRPQLQRILSELRAIPIGQVDPRGIETAIQRLPGVDECRFSRNVFGSGSLQVRFERPVASLAGTLRRGLGERGTILTLTVGSGRVTPVLAAPPMAYRPSLALCMPWRPAAIADLAAKLKMFAPNVVSHVEITSSGSVSFTFENGPMVRLGAADDIDVKFAKVRELLDENPRLLSEVSEINVAAPNRPALVPSRRGSQR